MSKRSVTMALLSLLALQARAQGAVMRNSELIDRMVSHFQGKGRPEAPRPPEPPRKDVVSVMQSVLCRNFPMIPCDVITADPKLRDLIEKSVQQIKYKKLSINKTTPPPQYQLTLFPTLNEDLSNFIQVSDTQYQKAKYKDTKKKSRKTKHKSHWSQETRSKSKEPRSRSAVFGNRMKMRKFYPHKIKYKDKNVKGDAREYSEEKLSMSVEGPDAKGADRKRFSFREEPSDPPVWRIDYMKHGEPSLNAFERDADLRGKLSPGGRGAGEGPAERARKDVLHPDVYIKKNFVRKSAADLASDDIE